MNKNSAHNKDNMLYYNHVYLSAIISNQQNPKGRKEKAKYIVDNIAELHRILNNELKDIVEEFKEKKSSSTTTKYFILTLKDLPVDHPLKKVKVRIGDHDRNPDENNPSKTYDNPFSVSPNETTIDRLVPYVTSIYNDFIESNNIDSIYSIVLTRRKIGTQIVKKSMPKVPLFEYHANIDTGAGKVHGVSRSGMKSAIENAFKNQSQKKKLKNVTDTEIEDIKNKAVNILTKYVEVMEGKGEDTDNITAVLTIVRDKYPALQIKEIVSWIYCVLKNPIIA